MKTTQVISLTREQFNNGNLVSNNNHVLIKILHNNDYVKSKGGIFIGIPSRDVFADEVGTSLAADMEECFGEVVRVPVKLTYDEDDKNSMTWETDMELQVGDTVWGGILEFHSALTVDVEGEIYKFIPYADLYVAKRYHPLINWDEVIVLNGYALLSFVNCQKISDLDVVSEDKIDPTKGIVSFIGKPNKSYKEPSYVDFEDLKVGDEVLLAPRTAIQYLERKKDFARFDGDNLYFVVPRRKIVCVTKRDE